MRNGLLITFFAVIAKVPVNGIWSCAADAIFALKLNVAGATSASSVSFEMISAVRGSVVGGSSSVDDSSTVISKVSDAVSPLESVAVRVTL